MLTLKTASNSLKNGTSTFRNPLYGGLIRLVMLIRMPPLRCWMQPALLLGGR